MNNFRLLFLLFLCAQLHAQEQTGVPQSLLDEVENGNDEVAYFIANSFLDGNGPSGEVNKDNGLLWMQKAAEMGSAHAMHELADALNADGKVAEALSWYQQAAEQGVGKAFEAIANYHYYGEGGLVKDCLMAYEWFEKAELKGVELAFNNHAWYLSTSADKKCRNPEKAVVVFSQLKEKYNTVGEMPWSYRDTEATVLAGIADFTAAITLQQQLVEDVLSYDGDVSQFDKHLQHFKQRKPLITVE